MIPSPYCVNYKIPIRPQEKGLIMQHLLVRKLTRRELEDKYLRLIDENFELKKENHQQKEKIKILTTKLLRLSKENFKYKSRDYLFLDEDNEIQESDEFFRPRRAISASFRKDDNTRNSTPNLISSRFKSEDFLPQDTFFLDLKNGRPSTAMNSKNFIDPPNDMRRPEDKAIPNRSPELENEVKKMKDEIDKVQKDYELEKKTNSQLEIQVKELKEKLSNDKVQKDLEANVQIITLNRKVGDLQTQYENLDKEYKMKLEECKKEQTEIIEQFEKEKIKVKKFEQHSRDLDASTKMVENLMERLAQVEKEKADLITHSDRFTVVSEEIAQHKMKSEELNKKLMEKEKELEKETSDRLSISHSQEELLQKMKNLQKENDELVVKLQGLRTENESLISKNRKLEDRVKELEIENKQQLEKLNDTLKTVESQKFSPPKAQNVIRQTDKKFETYTKSEKKLKSNSLKSSSESTDDDFVRKTLPIKDYLTDKKSGGFSETDKSRTDSSKVETQRLNESPLKKLSPNRSPGSTIDSSPMQSYLGVSEPSQKSLLKETELQKELASSSKRYLDSVPSQTEINEILSQEQVDDSDNEDFDPKTYSIDQVPTTANENAIDRARKILMEQVLSQIPQRDEEPKLSSSSNTNTASYQQESGFESESVYGRKSCDNDEWSIFTVDSTSRQKSSKEKVSNLAKYLERKSLTSVSSIESKKSSFITETDNDSESASEKWRKSYKWIKKPELIIEIVNLQLISNTDVMNNKSIKQLYVEYTFLSLKGHLLETPHSLPKPISSSDTLDFKFRKTFDLNFQKNDKQTKILKAMLEKNTPLPLRFLLISEPTESDLESDEEAECEEIGFATVNLYDLVKNSEMDIERLTVLVYATKYSHEPIAQLTIQIEGVNYLRDLLSE